MRDSFREQQDVCGCEANCEGLQGSLRDGGRRYQQTEGGRLRSVSRAVENRAPVTAAPWAVRKRRSFSRARSAAHPGGIFGHAEQCAGFGECMAFQKVQQDGVAVGGLQRRQGGVEVRLDGVPFGLRGRFGCELSSCMTASSRRVRRASCLRTSLATNTAVWNSQPARLGPARRVFGFAGEQQEHDLRGVLGQRPRSQARGGRCGKPAAGAGRQAAKRRPRSRRGRIE